MDSRAQRMIAGITAALLLLAMTPARAFAQAAVTQSDIQSIKDELAGIQAQKEEMEARLADIRDDLSQAEEQVELIQDQVLLTEQEINASQDILDQYGVQIADKTREIQRLEQQEEEQYQEFYRQVRWLEESGNVSYLSILFEARSLSEMLDYFMLIHDIMEYSQRIIDRLDATREELDGVRAALELDQADQAQVQKELEDKRAELDQRRADAQALLNQIAAAQSEYAGKAKELADSEARIDKELKDAEKRYADQIAALENQSGGPNVNAGSGNWYWPLPGRYYLSSLFGGRILYGAYDNHTGTDIPAPSGTPIYAAQGGVVTTVNSNPSASSYGIYCIINHGGGCVTLYGHQCQTPVVHEGDTVSKGQLIGYVGTTGNSTGNHLHFELRVNGVRGNVLKLYPGMNFTYRSNGQTITIQGG